MIRKLLAAVTLALLAGSNLISAGPAGSTYHLLKTVPLDAGSTAPEYFDYLMFDAEARRVYVSHGTEVIVVDADTWKTIGTIPGMKRCHGIAVAREFGKGFITDGEGGNIHVFDLKTLKVTGIIKADDDADSITYDPASKRVFSFNGDSKNSTVVDVQSGKAIENLPLPGGPEFPQPDGRGKIYVNSEDKNEVMVIDTKALKVEAEWPTAPAGGPTGMAMDREHRRLFSAGRKPAFLVVVNADTGKVIQSFPISGGVDACVFEPSTGLIFASTRDGMIHIFHEDSPDHYSVVSTVKTEFGAKTMALDPKTHNAIVSTASFAAPVAGARGRKAVPGTFRLLVFAP